MRIRLYNQKYEKDIIAKAKSYHIAGYDWEDIVQEIELALWKNLGKFKGKNNASEKTFALKIMRNRILDLAKTANRQKRFLDSHHFIFSQLEEHEIESAMPILGDFEYE